MSLLSIIYEECKQDTLYYPFDKWLYNKKIASKKAYEAQVDSVRVLGINLTESLDFQYSLSNKKFGFQNTVVRDYAFRTPYLPDIKNLQTMDIYKTKTSDFSLIFEWQSVQIIKNNTAAQNGYKEEQTIRVIRYVIAPEVNANKNLLLVLFMPCDQVMLLPVELMQLTQEEIHQQIKQSPDVTNKLHQLKNQHAKNQCSVD